MESPWLFFKDVYIISLKTEMERRKNFTKLLEERDCTNYKIINAVNGKPLLRSSVFCKSILLSFKILKLP